MFITVSVEAAAGATIVFVQVPCACSLLAVRTCDEVIVTGNMTISDGSTNVVDAKAFNNIAAGTVIGLALEADSIVKAVHFDIDKPIKCAFTPSAAGVMNLAFELDEFVRKTD